jgi:diacylglycerol kinase family enzyme
VGIGFHAELVRGASRELKSRLGNLAYMISALSALAEREVARYRLTLDGLEVETEGVTCVVANSGNLGLPGLRLSPAISVDDGLLDVLVFRNADLEALVSVAASVVDLDSPPACLQHFRARDVSVVADPTQPMDADGEPAGDTPCQATVLPEALEVVVPAVA